MIQSMSRTPELLDQRPDRELLQDPLKVERIHQFRCETRAQARLDIVDWIEGYYNLERLHSSINYPTPTAAKSSLMAA